MGATSVNIPSSTISSTFFRSEATLESLVQEWAKARIGMPMQVINRFDDAAKQLITIGSTLQGLYIALFVVGGVKTHMPGIWLGFLSASLGLMIFFAAQAICAVPQKMEAFGAYELFRTIPGPSDQKLTDALSTWCREVESIAKHKHRWLLAAKYSLFANSVLSFYVLSKVLWSGGWT